MHGGSDWVERISLFDDLYPKSQRADIDVLICPPAVFISGFRQAANEAGILLGGQDCHVDDSGAHTGSIAARMFADVGADYIILGHSERRAAGETSQSVIGKAKAAEAAGLVPIICVGENETQRDAGRAVETVLAQLKDSLPELNAVVVAYEPIWAIGTGKTAKPSDIAEMHDALREEVGPDVRLLYGGSVKPANAKDILSLTNVDGALIGGASLEPQDLAAIAKSAPHRTSAKP